MDTCYTPKKKDNVNGMMKHQDCRVSITYRKVKPKLVHELDPSGKVTHMLQDLFYISPDPKLK